MSIRGLVNSKPGHYPEFVQSQKNSGSALADNSKAMLPRSGQFHGFPLLLIVVGWVFGFLFSSFTHIANSPKGNTPEAPSSRGPLTTALTSNGAAQASSWCSPPASMLRVWVSQGHSPGSGGATEPQLSSKGRSGASAFPS